MVAGTLASAGYLMGVNLYLRLASNPKGFFEDPEINAINEDLLARILPKPIPHLGRWICRDRLQQWQRWLAAIPLSARISSTPEIDDRIKSLTSHGPFCFKDPRFSYTLPVWRPFLRNTVFVCVFRHPAATAASIIKECQTRDYLKGITINFDRALEVWQLMYRHILERHANDAEWLFIHYNQMLRGEGVNRLAALTQAAPDKAFVAPGLNRSRAERPVSRRIQALYEQLCSLAGYVDTA